MASSGSTASSTRGEGPFAEEDSRASSICQEGLSAEANSEGSSVSRETCADEEDSSALSICDDGASAEEESKGSSVNRAWSYAEDSNAFSLCEEGASAEEDLDDADLIACYDEISKFKRARQAVSEERSNGRSKLDVGIWGTLDDHLLEKIIARLPFNSLFRASSLSKTWRLRVHSHSFQSEVHLNSSSASSPWKSYAPLFLSAEKHLVGYESGSKRWCKLPTHSPYLSEDMMQNWRLVSVAGSLFCWLVSGGGYGFVPHRQLLQVHVTNPLTQSWKRLPPRPVMSFPKCVHVGLQGNEAYKVLLGSLLQNERRVFIRLQIFDSTANSWTMESYGNTGEYSHAKWGGSAFFNEFLHVLVFTWERECGFTVISFDMKEKVWKERPYLSQVFDNQFLRYRYDNCLQSRLFVFGSDEERSNLSQSFDNQLFLRYRYDNLLHSRLFVFGSDVMLLVVHVDAQRNRDYYVPGDDTYDPSRVFTVVDVFRLDLERDLACEVSRAPKEMVSRELGWSTVHAAAYGDRIYVGGEDISHSFIVYNTKSQEWHSVSSVVDSALFSPASDVSSWRWTSLTYQPGLNPFLEV